MLEIFTEKSTYKYRAKWLAIGWTLLIFVLCFLPGNELPKVNVPFIDKWAHVILFAVFSFLWLCAIVTVNTYYLVIVFCITVFVGWLVEFIQGHYVSGRYQDNMDTFADSVGGLLGIVLFVLIATYAKRKLITEQTIYLENDSDL